MGASGHCSSAAAREASHAANQCRPAWPASFGSCATADSPSRPTPCSAGSRADAFSRRPSPTSSAAPPPRAGIGKHVTAHTLRHTAATWLRQELGDTRLVAEYLGHADLSTVARYAHVDRDELFDAAGRLEQIAAPEEPAEPSRLRDPLTPTLHRASRASRVAAAAVADGDVEVETPYSGATIGEGLRRRTPAGSSPRRSAVDSSRPVIGIRPYCAVSFRLSRSTSALAARSPSTIWRSRFAASR